MKSRRKREYYASLVAAALLGAFALVPFGKKKWRGHAMSQRLDAIEATERAGVCHGEPLSPNVALRLERLAPLLASWGAIGGCGACGTGGAGVGVKRVRHNAGVPRFQPIPPAD